MSVLHANCKGRDSNNPRRFLAKKMQPLHHRGELGIKALFISNALDNEPQKLKIAITLFAQGVLCYVTNSFSVLVLTNYLVLPEVEVKLLHVCNGYM